MKRLIIFWLLLSLPTLADPCGMVPPISLDGGDANIERIGEQKTYVFYKDGLETVVIHPGFRGSVDEFGMLIPFPNVPALRKVPETTFDQFLAAIDPPKMTFWIDNYLDDNLRMPSPSGMVLEESASEVNISSVKVLKEEAVGMYEIAVLEAGSPRALRLWMEEHGYQFPDGMEPTCQDYIRAKWCFVAVKTRVGAKSRVNPRPGMRNTDASKPKGAVFSGKVQAMGFRFRSERMVVPMRLSTFNGGDLNNTLYVLTEEGVRAKNMPKELVKRQITGEKLYANLTEDLPYEIKGGTEDDMSPNDWKRLKAQIDPKPHSAVAADLFASDLSADDLGKLTHSYEEREKSLLDIGERLNLRGGRLDDLHATELVADKEEIKRQSLALLKSMTLTIIQGEFPREIIANENILFEAYELDEIESLAVHSAENLPMAKNQGDYKMAFFLSCGIFLTLLLCVARRRESAVAFLGLMILLAPQARAQEGLFTSRDWIDLLDVPERSKQAISELKSRGRAAEPYLIARFKNEDAPVTERGYCLALLMEASRPSRSSVDAVWGVSQNSSSQLVKLWSQAALVQMTDSPKELLSLLDADYAKKHGDPDRQGKTVRINGELQRPVALKLKDWSSQLSLEEQLRFMGIASKAGRANNVSPTINNVISPLLKSAEVQDLVTLMLRSDGQEVRRLSAALLAGFKEEKRKAVFSTVMEDLSVDSSAKDVPWAGGALFLPQFSNMNKSEARELITALTRWSIWTDVHKTDSAQVRPLENNLRSYSLWTAADGKSANWRGAQGGKGWLKAYSTMMGEEAAIDLLKEQNVSKNSALWAAVRK